MQCLFNNNGNSALSATGNYCTLLSPAVGIGSLAAATGSSSIGADLAASTAAGYQISALENISYFVGCGAGATGTATFQSLEMDGTGPGGAGQWRALVTPAPITLAATTNFNGTIAGPFLGLRIALSGSVAGTTYARLAATVRTGSL